MQIANSIIGGIGAANSLINSGVNLGQAIYNYNSQKINKINNEANKDAQIQIGLDIQSGKIKVTNEGEGLGYTGLSQDVETIRKQYKEQIEKELNGTLKKRALNELDKLFSELNLGAFNMAKDQSVRNLKDQLDTDINSAIQQYINTNDNSFLVNTINNAKAWMSEEAWNAYADKVSEAARTGKLENISMKLAREQGMPAVDRFLTDQNVKDEKERLTITASSQKAFNTGRETEKEQGVNIFTQYLKDNPGEIGKAYNTAISTASENIDYQEARKEAVQKEQKTALIKDFWGKHAEINNYNLSQLQQAKRDLQGSRGNYQDQPELYAQHMSYLDGEIAQKKNATGGSHSATAIRQDAENAIKNLLQEFHRGNVKGDNAIFHINSVRELTPDVAANAIAEILGRDGDKLNLSARQTYLDFEGIATQFAPDKQQQKDDPERYARYQERTRQAREAIFQAYYTGVRGDDLAKLTEGYRQIIASDVMSTIMDRGDIGKSGIGAGRGKNISADEGAAAFAFHSNRGHTDLIYSERTTDPNRPHHTTALTIGGQGAENVMQQAAKTNLEWANKELSGTGITLEWLPENVVRDATGDRDGVIHYKGSDGRTYRVDALSEHPSSRVVEVKIGDKWVQEDWNAIRKARNSSMPLKVSTSTSTESDFERTARRRR